MSRNTDRRRIRHTTTTVGILTAAVAGTAVGGMALTTARATNPPRFPIAAPAAAVQTNDLMPGTEGRFVLPLAAAAAPAQVRPAVARLRPAVARPRPAARPRPVRHAAARPVTRKAPARASRSTVRVALSPRATARVLLARRGWGTSTQFSCIDSLWTKESGWNARANNASSGAYGIPQSLPGSKMRSAGADWRTNPATQISWGLGYIANSYGSPCSAWAHSQAHDWY